MNKDNIVNNDGNGNIAPSEYNPQNKDFIPKDELWAYRLGNQ